MSVPKSPSASWLRPAVKNKVFGPAPGVAGAKRSPQSPSIATGPPLGPAERALELAARRVVGVDAAVAEVADQDVAAEGAEGRRGARRRRPCPGLAWQT